MQEGDVFKTKSYGDFEMLKQAIVLVESVNEN